MKKLLLTSLLASSLSASSPLWHIDILSQINREGSSTIGYVEHNIPTDQKTFSCTPPDDSRDDFEITMNILQDEKQLGTTIEVKLFKNNPDALAILLATKTLKINGRQSAKATLEGYISPAGLFNLFKKGTNYNFIVTINQTTQEHS